MNSSRISVSSLVQTYSPATHLFTGHNYIGTEHILLGLLREGEGVAARVLETLGADPAKIRTQVRIGWAALLVHSVMLLQRRILLDQQGMCMPEPCARVVSEGSSCVGTC